MIHMCFRGYEKDNHLIIYFLRHEEVDDIKSEVY